MQQRLHLKVDRKRIEQALAGVEQEIVGMKKAVRRNAIRKHKKIAKLRAVASAYREAQRQ